MKIKYLFAALVASLVIVPVSCDKEPDTGSEEVRVEGISVNPSQLTIKVGETDTLSYEIIPADAENKNAAWSSQNERIAIVDEDGIVTGVAPGTVEIMAHSEEGNFLDMAEVTVLEAEVRVNSVSIDVETVRLFPGETYPLEYVVEPVNATNTDVSWSSGDESVATVSTEGVITAVAIGETEVTVTTVDGGFTASCTVLVLDIKGPTFTLEMVPIEAGTFMMGAPETEPGYLGETQHEVTLTRDYYMSIYEITTTQYAEFLNSNNIGQEGTGEVTYIDNGEEVTAVKLFVSDCTLPDVSLGGAWDHALYWNAEKDMWEPVPGCEEFPMGHVSWYGAVAFADWYGAELPTEAQWEYAYRAGTQTVYPWGDDPEQVNDYAWIYAADGQMPVLHPVGGKLPNAWGLYDMAGELMEYCYDWYSELGSEPVTDPVGPLTGEFRVLRGSCITHNYFYCRSAYRNEYDPEKTGAGGLYGFRVIMYE